MKLELGYMTFLTEDGRHITVSINEMSVVSIDGDPNVCKDPSLEAHTLFQAGMCLAFISNAQAEYLAQ